MGGSLKTQEMSPRLIPPVAQSFPITGSLPPLTSEQTNAQGGPPATQHPKMSISCTHLV